MGSTKKLAVITTIFVILYIYLKPILYATGIVFKKPQMETELEFCIEHSFTLPGMSKRNSKEAALLFY